MHLLDTSAKGVNCYANRAMLLRAMHIACTRTIRLYRSVVNIYSVFGNRRGHPCQSSVDCPPSPTIARWSDGRLVSRVVRVLLTST